MSVWLFIDVILVGSAASVVDSIIEQTCAETTFASINTAKIALIFEREIDII